MNRPNPVSYTRLDVYKRQIHGYIAAGSVGNSMGELMEGYTVEERQKYWGWVDYLPEVVKHTPVSYTHLQYQLRRIHGLHFEDVQNLSKND